MGAIPHDLAVALHDELGLRRAIETGTHQGGGARELAAIFGSVATIEISAEMRREAEPRLAGLPGVDMIAGDSRVELPRLVDAQRPTFYWPDGHWSGGDTESRDAECPLLAELAALAGGHSDDCVAIEDARHFAAPPPPPHDPTHWPTLVEVLDALRAARPGAHVTVVLDLVVAVPRRAKPLADAWAQRVLAPLGEAPAPGRGRLRWLRR